MKNEKYDPDLVKKVADALHKANLDFVMKYGHAGNSVSLSNYAFAIAAIDAVYEYEDEVKWLKSKEPSK